MKVYSDTLTQADLREALPKGVTLAVLEIISNTRKRRNGWIVSLSGSSPYRSQMSEGGHRAATWDEHGLWMAELYRRDPNAVIGWYKTLDDFLTQTRQERDRVSLNFGERTASERKYRDSHKAPWLTTDGKLHPERDGRVAYERGPLAGTRDYT